jgi:hypothetical protein
VTEAGRPAGALALRQILLSAAVGLATAAVCAWAYSLPGPTYSDFEGIWIGARALVRGGDPYLAVERARLLSPLYYPLPAVVLAAPLGFVSFPVARAVVAGLAGFSLALAGFRQREHVLLVALLGAGFWMAFIAGQWSPFLTAGAVLPLLGALWVAKPSIGLALAVAYPSRVAFLGGALVVAFSFLVMPHWVGAWRAALGAAIHVPPVMRPGGFLLLLALLRWRRPEARLVAALACVPQMTVLYETVPLFLVPKRRAEAYVLVALSLACAVLQEWLVPATAVVPTVARRWPLVLGLVYLPALVMVLRRPNEGRLPWPLERAKPLERASLTPV